MVVWLVLRPDAPDLDIYTIRHLDAYCWVLAGGERGEMKGTFHEGKLLVNGEKLKGKEPALATTNSKVKRSIYQNPCRIRLISSVSGHHHMNHHLSDN